MLRFPFFAIVLGTASSLAAQAPHVSPKGDPSVRNDTIYALAAKPGDYPDEDDLVLLDDGIVRYEADGRGVTTYRQVYQILKQEAVERHSEHSFSYAPGHQKLTVNWMRVVKPNGEVVSDKPAQTQESDVPAELGDPVYTERKVIRSSLSGVAVGTIVDVSWTLEELKPFRRGDFMESWSISMGLPVKRSRYIVDVPASLGVKILEKNLDFRRAEAVKGGRRTYVWAAKELAKVKGEPYAADSNGVYMSVQLAAPSSWSDIATWYHSLARDRYTVTPPVAARLRQIVAGARTRDDTIRAVHKWVAQDVRYVSLSLGVGGYQPRAPETVLDTGFGDCKDKATFFVAALRSFGIEAYPVLLAASGGVERTLPSIDQFDHAIAAVRTGTGYTFVDLTASMVPYGLLPYSMQGEFALVVRQDGKGEEVTLPLDPIAVNQTSYLVVGTVTPDGMFNGRYEERAQGASQYGMRQAFEAEMDSTQRVRFLRNIAGKLFVGANGDSLVAFRGKDLSAEPKVTLVLRNGRATKRSGDTQILDLPIGSMSGLENAATDLEDRGPRRFPLDAARVMGASVTRTELRITLPEGWRARVPRGVKATSRFGSYESEYAQAGRELRIVRQMTGARGVLAPDQVGELVNWFREVSKDDVEFIVLEVPSQKGS